MSACRYLVGIDVGSTTIKAVVVDPQEGDLLWSDYQRHKTKQPEKLLEFLGRMEEETGIAPDNCRVFMTGSGGNSLAGLIGARFVQEVHAVSLSVEKRYPEVYSVIELGGQDAKIIVFKDNLHNGRKKKIPSMNDKCAGGTGAVIDKICAKLKIPAASLNDLGYDGIKLHPVAGKCGVFAETDINGLQKQGIPEVELMASLFQALVMQNLTVLARGHTLFPDVLLLGGPNTFIRGMQEAWQHNIPILWKERKVPFPEGQAAKEWIKVPENAELFAALGAAESGRVEHEEDAGNYAGTGELARYIDVGRKQDKLRSGAPGIGASKPELEEFRGAFTAQPFVPRSFRPGETVRCFLGIDGGSTSTKAVLISEDKELLCKAYQLSGGNPIQDTIEVVDSLRRQVESSGAGIDVLGVGTTGYAKDILADVLQADVALVETVAHTESAVSYYDDPHVIVDVGGQDIKLIMLTDGRVKDFKINTQCSAGNGYFLQSTAEGFGIEMDEYAELALSAEAMPVFGYGCAVFLQSDIVDFQRQGWQANEILCGLAAVLPKNIFLYVAGVPNLARLGTRFILQGGTQKNLAAVKAQVDFIRSNFEAAGIEPEIIVHKHCGEAGAIGAAAEAVRLWLDGRQTTFIGLASTAGISYRTTRSEETRCNFCRNLCLRTFIDVQTTSAEPAAPSSDPTDFVSKVPLESGERRMIIATCEKGSVEDLSAMRGIKADIDAIKRVNPNLADIAGRLVWRAQHPESVADPVPSRAWTPSARRRIALMERRSELRIGIPRVLNMYVYAPLFSAYLESLGVVADNIVYSDFTNAEMYKKGTSRGSIDPCFPAKIALSHVHDLVHEKHLKKPLDCIFFPMVEALQSEIVGTQAQHCCPTITATPESLEAAYTKEEDFFGEHGLTYLHPLLDLEQPEFLARQMFETWEPLLGLSGEENERAMAAGFCALEAFQTTIRDQAREVIEMLEREDRLGIVLLGRPYHHDPGVNHGIPEEFQKLGYPVLTQSTLPLDEDLLERLFGDEVRSGAISHPLDISDVWKNASQVGTNHKLWAAKFTARHPNLVALELSSFKCGHDAPVYAVVEEIIERSGTPYFSFKDLDENKPAGSIKLRVETIDYFLRRYREEMVGRREVGARIDEAAAEYERRLAETSPAAAPQPYTRAATHHAAQDTAAADH